MEAQAVFIIILFLALGNVRGFIFTKFLSAKCLVLDPKSIELNYCFVKSYSRTNTVLNISVNFTRTLHKPGYVSYISKTKNITLRQLNFVTGPDFLLLQVWHCLSKNIGQPSIWVVRCNGEDRYKSILQANDIIVQGFCRRLLPPMPLWKSMTPFI